MSGAKRTVTNEGTNKQGNDYKSYDDGGFRYTNKDSAGNTNSKYFDTGKGHGFYEPKGERKAQGGQPWHENQNQGYRETIEKGGNNKKK